jgi:hypothetical protein
MPAPEPFEAGWAGFRGILRYPVAVDLRGGGSRRRRVIVSASIIWVMLEGADETNCRDLG